jgi:hypothetical protein
MASQRPPKTRSLGELPPGYIPLTLDGARQLLLSAQGVRVRFSPDTLNSSDPFIVRVQADGKADTHFKGMVDVVRSEGSEGLRIHSPDLRPAQDVVLKLVDSGINCQTKCELYDSEYGFRYGGQDEYTLLDIVVGHVKQDHVTRQGKIPPVKEIKE